MAEGRSGRQVIGVDFVRFVAAFLVMVFHLAYSSWAADGTTAKAMGRAASFPEVVSVSWFGWVGVEIFFVISGFVISYSAGGATPGAFALSRFRRLVPAVVVCATATFLVSLLIDLAPWQALVRSWVRTLIFYPFSGWIDGVYWSLPIEIVFYLLVYLLLRIGRYDSLPRLAAVVGLASSTFSLARLALLVAGVAPKALVTGQVVDLTLISHGCFFAMGVTFWVVAARGFTAARGGLIAALAVGGSAEIAVVAAIKGADLAAAWLPVAVWLGASFLVLASAVWADAVGRGLRFAAPLARRVGLATYPLYLLHAVIGGALMGALIRAGVDRYVALAGAMLFALGAAFVVAEWAEPRVRQAGGAVWRRFALRRARQAGLVS